MGFYASALPALDWDNIPRSMGSAVFLLTVFNIVYFMLGSYFGIFSLFPTMATTKTSIALISGTFIVTYPIIMTLTIEIHRRWRRVSPAKTVRENLLIAFYSYGVAVPINFLVNLFLTGGHPYTHHCYYRLINVYFGASQEYIYRRFNIQEIFDYSVTAVSWGDSSDNNTDRIVVRGVDYVQRRRRKHIWA